VKSALVKLGNSLARVKIWGRSTPSGRNMVFQKKHFGWIHRDLQGHFNKLHQTCSG